MDDYNDQPSQAPQDETPQPVGPPPVSGPVQPMGPQYYAPKPRGGGWRVFWGILFFLSVLANIGMFLLLMGMFVFVAAGNSSSLYQETVLDTGARANKIVVINLTGVIDNKRSKAVIDQLKMARKDEALCGLILRVNSPGGTVSASDLIYHELTKFKEDKKVPMVAFMQGVAASGGYYASVACDKIVSEPTVITGSIGVIMSHFVIGDLLEDKLGVLPVVVKSGQKKDWPSSYQAPTDEQMQYLQDRVVQPAYQRFLEVVAEGRQDVLTSEELKPLADGGIYTAQQAMDNHLIDQVGYFEDVVELVKDEASIFSAQVVQYENAFSLFNGLLGSRSPLGQLNHSTLLEWAQPQVMYLWKAY